VIDPQLLRDAPDVIKTSQRARGESESLVDDAVAADLARRAAIASFEELRAEQNAFGKTVAKAPKDEKAALVAQAQQLAAKVKEAQAASTEADAAFDTAVRSLGNVVVDGVPAGGEENFATLREVGTRPSFDFEPLDHADLGEKLGAIDLKRGTKVSGSRFYFLRGIGARLELALMNMALDKALQNDFTPLITPTLVRPEIMAGTGFLGSHSDEVYHLPADDLYLTGTSEVALAGYHSDEILDVADGPVRYAGWSTCYRREAGAAGKDNRGILRVHQFNKLEMFSYVHPDQAEQEHDALVALQESMMQALGLNYRVIDVAAGDLGSSAARKFESGKTAPVATLNGTLATTRWLVAILETHQQADGSVVVPEALRPWLGGLEVIEPVA
jgi:seryl-tRNA synthetase